MTQEFKKMVLMLGAGYAGMRSAEFHLVPTSMTEDELETYAWHAAVDFASAYGIYPTSDLEGLSDEELAEIDDSDYTDNIEGWFVDYNPDKHDGLRVGGDISWRVI
jgi:hypothetical protein